MSDTPKQDRPTPLGIYERPRAEGLTGFEIAAGLFSLVWVIGATILFFVLPGGDGGQTGLDHLRWAVTLLAIILPVGMIWLAATVLRSSRTMFEESQRLQAAIDTIRQAYIAQAQSGNTVEPSVAKKLDEIAAATRKTESALATFSSRRETEAVEVELAQEPMQLGDEVQPSLGLEALTEDLAPPIAHSDFIRALNFPETAEDEDGFAALRRAMRDRSSAQLIQAAQDVLTLLSQDGVYMDDLQPDRARPETWRLFAAGDRGRAIASLGGVHDRQALALAAGRLKKDPIFRDAAHHFLRLFDRTFAAFAERASDAEISSLANTRTSRAFMLLGRVAGTFD
ncbi:MAG: hypothetical protein ACFB11_16180 [Paracoccaceae bacterium]